MPKGPQGQKRPADTVANAVWSMDDIVAPIDAAEASRQFQTESLPPYPIHHIAGGDDRSGRAAAVVRVALLDAVGRHQGDPEIAVHIGADDGLVVARNRPGEGLLGIGDGS